MLAAARMAGTLAAHAIWSVSEDGPLNPILGIEDSDGSRRMNRLMSERLEDCVRLGLEKLESNPDSALRAVFIYDGYITLGEVRTDCLFVDGRSYVGRGSGFQLAVPYRNSDDAAGFAVYKPKLLQFTGEQDEIESLVNAFFEGVGQHEQGAAVWSASLDESL